MFKKEILLSSTLATLLLFSGCSNLIPKPDNPLNVKEISSDRVPIKSLKREKRENNLNKYVKNRALESPTELSPDQIVRTVIEEDQPPRILTTKKIENMEMFSAKLGDVIRLILNDIDVNFIVEPNVDLNTPVSFKIANKNIYDALKKVCESAGYYIYYDGNKESLVLSRFITKKYYIPSNIFVERKADISFGASGESGSSITPTFDINNKPPKDVLNEVINKTGSTEKIVNIDEQSGVIVVKERINFINEIDDAIKDYVLERIEQFNVELAVVEVSSNKLDEFGLEIADITKDDFKMSSLAGTPVSPDALGATISKGGVVITGWDNYFSFDSADPIRRSEWAFKMILIALKNIGAVNIVEKPNVLVQNHSIGYVSVGEENNYVKSVKVIPGRTLSDGSRTPDMTEPQIDTYKDGLQFVVRVDKYRNKDMIGLSLAPILSFSELVPGPNGIQLLNRKVRETMSVVNVKDGDIIILGGIKINQGTGSGNEPKLLENVPLLSSILGKKSTNVNQVETMFIVRVHSIKHAYETEKIPSLKTKTLYNRF